MEGKLKKKITSSILGILAILLLTSVSVVGCMPTNTTTDTTTTTVTPLSELQTWRTNIDTWKTTVADPAIAKVGTIRTDTVSQTEIDSVNTRIATMQAQLTALSATVDAQADEIEALQEEVEDITTSAVASGNVSGTTGNIQQFEIGSIPTVTTSVDGGIISQVNFPYSGNKIYSTDSNSNQVYYVQRLINQNNASVLYAIPEINLNYEGYYYSYYDLQKVKNISVVMTSPNFEYTGDVCIADTEGDTSLVNGDGDKAYYVYPPLGDECKHITITPNYSSSYITGIPISAGQYVDITVRISDLYSEDGGTWEVIPSIQ